MDHRTALLILNMLPGIGPGRKRQLAAHFGSAAHALSASERELQQVPSIGPRLAPILRNWHQHCDPESEIKLAQQAGVSIIIDEDEAYPPLLRQIHDPPICLYVSGCLQALQHSAGSIAIVGTRHTSFYGLRMANLLATSAAQTGWPVISGLARGIDTAAHEATLRAGGVTVAVIGSGLACLYPRENIGLALRITEQQGAVISEFPMQYRPDRRSFPMRNRIISGIARGTIVVEAGNHSGSLITAAQALEQNRYVFAVPGLADSPHARGCHALIRDGAKLIENFQDVIDDFTLLPLPGTAGLKTELAPGIPPEPPAAAPVLHGLELKLWKLAQQGEVYIDDLIAMSDEETSSVLAALLTLELKRLIKQLPGKRIAPI